MASPKFLKLDPDLFRRLPAGRKAAAALAAYREWEPEASLTEIAGALGLSEATARRWATWLEEDAAGTPSKTVDRRLRCTNGAVRGAVCDVTNGAVCDVTNGALSTMDETIRGGEGEKRPPAPLVARLQDETDEAASVILAAAYMARTTRRNVTTAEAHAVILDDLRSDRYTAPGLAKYLEATPHVDVYPRQLAQAVANYLEHLNLSRTEAKRQTAWAAIRRRLRNVSVGDVAWPTEDPGARPWAIIDVDVEAGRVHLKRRTPAKAVYGEGGVADGPLAIVYAARAEHDIVDECTLTGPVDLAGWAFESETMPLFAAHPKQEEI